MYNTYEYSILGMNLFGCKFCDKDGDETDCDRKNFDTLLWALVTVFQVDAIFCPSIHPLPFAP